MLNLKLQNMNCKKTIKTEKLKPEDRHKLIDRPELLVVIPKTHPASVRYGCETKWCTAAVSNKRYFEEYTRGGNFLVYLIYYDLRSSSRNKVITKVGIRVQVKNNELMFEGFSQKNDRIPEEILLNFILTPEIINAINEYKNIALMEKYGFYVGSDIFLDDYNGDFDKIEIKLGTQYSWEMRIWLAPIDIGRCVVTKINEK